MSAYTGAQLLTRLLALALGLAGGLCQTVWSQVVGMRCGATAVGEYVYHRECLAWTELFLRFPPGAADLMVSVVLVGAIAGFAAGIGGMWRPRWAALLFGALALLNLGLAGYAAVSGAQAGIALGLSALAVIAPAGAGAALWQRGEYRPPSPAARAGAAG